MRPPNVFGLALQTAFVRLLPLAAIACSSSSSGSPPAAMDSGATARDTGAPMESGTPTDAHPEAQGPDSSCPAVDAGLQPPGCSSAGATVNDGVACCSTSSTDNGNGTFTCLCSDGPSNQTGFSCNVKADCCSGPCYNFACCTPPQGACTGDGDCCSGSCSGGKCACSPAGAFCTVDADCCGCASCVAGQCSG